MPKKPPQPRIFEYMADDGTIYWSLDRGPIVSLPTRLTLQDKRGLILGHFLGLLRLRALATQVEEFEDEVEG